MDHEDIRSHYDDLYRTRPGDAFPFSESRTRCALAPVLRELSPGSRILDVGCGVGYTCEMLSRAGYRVAGTDISGDALELARDRLPKAEFCLALEDQKLPWEDDRFDGIICLGALEHLSRPEALLAECARVLRAGGLAIFVVPNSRSPYFVFSSGTGQLYEEPRTRDQWSGLFARSGFHVHSVGRDPGPPLARENSLWRNLKLLAHRCLNRLPVSLTYQFLFELRAEKAGADARVLVPGSAAGPPGPGAS